MKSHGPGELNRMINLLSKLPGLGPRSSTRMALQLFKQRDSLMKPLARAISEAAEVVTACSVCGNLDSANPCQICSDGNRNTSTICVVKEVGDVWALERSGVYRGYYHVLGGLLSALDGISPEDLRCEDLIKRASNPDVKEVILAMDATIDGQTTAHYLSEVLSKTNVSISRLARGMPVGGELEYLDDGTIAQALNARATL
ncbi:MAG: recombination mediator RecR [Nisaea sp.]|nr:recombination mediator RecR [Nisaea sp.]